MISMTVANSVTTSTPLVDAIAEVETNGAEPTHIIAAPDTWTAIRKLKAGDASNQPLVNQDVATETQRQVEGLPVIVNRHAEPGSLLIIDRSEIISSVSQIELATTKTPTSLITLLRSVLPSDSDSVLSAVNVSQNSRLTAQKKKPR